jgi:hypothetical protein
MNEFEEGDRVELNAIAQRRLDKDKRTGTVSTTPTGESVEVKWDGNETGSYINQLYISKINGEE